MTILTDVRCQTRCGTLNKPHFSIVMSADYRVKKSSVYGKTQIKQTKVENTNIRRFLFKVLLFNMICLFKQWDWHFGKPKPENYETIGFSH